MGVIDKAPIIGPKKTEDGLYTFSSRPTTPGERGPELLVRFQAVSKTQQCIAHKYISVNSRTKLSIVRRHITKHFRNHFERGFIFIGKRVQILKSKERDTTVFDILPKLPQISNELNENFKFQDVQYKRVTHDYDGSRYVVICACIIYLFEQSKVSHWAPDILREELSANVYEGFSFIPTDILSWKQYMIDSRAPTLHRHAALGKREELEITIQQIPYGTKVLHLCDERGYSPLHYASENGHLDVCETLLAGIGKSQLYQVDRQGKSPLHCALYRNRCSTITYLLQMESDVLRKDFLGNSCLDLLLLQSDSNLDYIVSNLEFQYVDRYLQYTLAHHILKRNAKKQLGLKISASLHKYKADETNPSQFGTSLLHLSSSLDKGITENLLQKGFPKLERDIIGLLPFHQACKNGSKAQIKLLYYDKMEEEDFRLGLHLTLKRKRYAVCQTVLELRPRLELDETTVCIILEKLNQSLEKQRKKGADSNFKGWRAMAKQLLPIIAKEKDALNVYVFDSAYYGLADTLKLLKQLGVDFNISDMMGRRPLHEACQRNHTDCISILLNNGADPNCGDWRNATPLHYSCEKGHVSAAKLLLANGANPALTDGCGRTALMTSIYCRHMEAAKYMLNHPSITASLTAIDNHGQGILHYTPLMNEECVDILLTKLAPLKGIIGGNPPEITPNKSMPSKIAWDITQKDKNFRLSFEAQFKKKKKKPEPFRYSHDTPLWKSRSNPSTVNGNTNYLKISLETCPKCGMYKRNNTHVCHRVWTKEKLGIVEEVVKVKVAPFEYHTQERKFCLPSIHVAARCNHVDLLKKLIKFDPKCISSTDEHSRNILEYAVDQGSLKLVKQITNLTSVLLSGTLIHRVLMCSSYQNGETAKSLLVHLFSAKCQHNEIAEPISVKHKYCEKSYNPSSLCHRHCHSKSFTPLELTIEMQNFTLFKLILDKTKSNFGLALHFAAYFGSPVFFEAIHKKKKKVIADNPSDPDAHDLLRIDYLYALNIICCSPFVNVEIMNCLFKCHPEILQTTEILDLTDLSLSEVRPHIEQKMDLSNLAHTPLGKLLSPSHPCMRKDNRKNVLDTIGRFVIESGLLLGTYTSYQDNDYPTIVHCACEALYNAMESGHYGSAEDLIRNAGDIVWKCSFSDKQCSVQREFPKRQTYFSAEEKSHYMYIKYILMLSCRDNVPSLILDSLLEKGQMVSKETEDLAQGQSVPDIFHKLIGSIFYMVQKRGAKSQSLKLLRYAPLLFPVLSGMEASRFEILETNNREMRLLRSSARMMCQSKIADCTQIPARTSLLHFACATGNQNFVKMILKAPLPPSVKQKNEKGVRAIDIAAAYGHLAIVRLLLDEGASLTSDILVAACAKTSYMGTNEWAKHVNEINGCDQSTDKTRSKLVKELLLREDIDVGYCHSEHGSPLYCAVMNRLDDIILQLIEKSQSSLFLTLNIHRECAEKISTCQEKTVLGILAVIGRSINKICYPSLGQLALYIAANSSSNVLQHLTNMLSRSLSNDSWKELLCEKDKHGRTALHFIASRGNIQAADVFTRHTNHIYADVKDFSQSTPLWQSLAHMRWKVAEILLLRGAWPQNLVKAVPGLNVKRTYNSSELDHVDILKFGSHTEKDVPRVKTQHSKKRMFPRSMHKSPGVSLSLNQESAQDTERGQAKIIPKMNTSHKSTILKSKISEQSAIRTRVRRILKLPRKNRPYFTNVNCSLIHVACYTGDKKLLEQIIPSLKNYLPDVHDSKPNSDHNSDHDSDFDSDHHSDKDVVHKPKYHFDYHSRHTENDVFKHDAFLNAVIGGHFATVDKLLAEYGLHTFSAERLIHALIYKFVSSSKSRKQIQSSLSNFTRMIDEESEEDKDLTQEKISYLGYFINREEKYIELAPNFTFSPIEKDWMTPLPVKYLENMLTFTMEHDSDDTIDGKMILYLALQDKPWVIKSVLEASRNNRSLKEKLNAPLISGFSLLDCIIIASGRCNKLVTLEHHEMVQNIENILENFELGVSQKIIELAAEKGLWVYLIPIARHARKNDQEFFIRWQEIFSKSARTGQVEFLQSVVDMSISKMDRRIKTCFTACLYVAAISGQTNIVKYLLKQGTPILADGNDPILVDLLGKLHTPDWGLLNYAIKGNKSDTVDAIVKFCRHDRDFMRVSMNKSLFPQVVATGNPAVMKMIINLYPGHGGNTPTVSEWTDYLIIAARKGYEKLCIYMIDQTDADVRFTDEEHKTILHYSARRKLADLSKKLVEKCPTLLHSIDRYGMKPVDYAYAVGSLSLVEMFLQEEGSEPNQSFDRLECYGCLSLVLQKNSLKRNEAEIVDLMRRCSGVRSLELKNLLMRSDDHTSSIVINASRYAIRQFLTDDTDTYGHLFHLAARHGCIESLRVLCNIMGNATDVLQRILRMSYKGLTPLAWAIQSKNLDCIKVLAAYDPCLDWRKTSIGQTRYGVSKPATGENILHLAVKSQCQKVIEIIIQMSQDLLKEDDNYKCSPLVCIAAFGLHNFFDIVLSEETVETEEHKSHSYENIQSQCIECILNHAIGWSKLYQEGGYNFSKRPIRAMEIVNQTSFENGRNQIEERTFLERTYWRYGENSPITASVMAAMGYLHDPLTILKYIALFQPPWNTSTFSKLLKKPGFEIILPDLLAHGVDANMILEISIINNATKVFTAMASHLHSFNDKMRSKFNLSVFEVVIGLGKLNLLDPLRSKLSMDFAMFHELTASLPQRILWVSELENPDNIFQADSSVEENYVQRLTKADAWLASSFDKDVQESIEMKSVSLDGFPTEIHGKKFSVDFNSFRKHKYLSDKSNYWIYCFLASSLIYGELMLKCSLDEPKLKSCTSIKVLCIPSGTSDHPKTVVDTNGILMEYVGLTRVDGSLCVQYDTSIQQHCIDSALKDNIQKTVLPDIRQLISTELGLSISLRIDWAAIEMKKRTSNAEAVLKALSGDVFGNRLGGLEDTLRDCIDMKNDIEAMFNQETFMNAMEPATAVREIVVALDDHRSGNDAFPLRPDTKRRHETWRWSFSVEKSTLLYDRTSFPLWNYLNLFRGACASYCGLVSSLSRIHPSKDSNRTERNTGETILEIEWKSFGMSNDHSLHKLICQDVSREILSIAYHCQAMLRLEISVNRVLVKNVAAVQYTGYSIVDSTAIVSVCTNNSTNKNWYVEQSNTQVKLAELEDKQLLNKWTSNELKNVKDEIKDYQAKISECIGMSVQVSLDERRILSTVFAKCRREMTHPYELVNKGLSHTLVDLQTTYSDYMNNILFFSPTTSIKESTPFECKNGLWIQAGLDVPEQALLKVISLSPFEVVRRFETSSFRPLRSIEKQTFTAGNDVGQPNSQVLLSTGWQMVENNNATKENAVVFTYDNKVYELSDNTLFSNLYFNIPKKLCIAHNVVESLKTRGNDSMKERLNMTIDSTVRHKDVINTTKNLHSSYCQKILRVLPIKDIRVNWKSFETKKEVDVLAYMNCMLSLVDTVYMITGQGSKCSSQYRIEHDILDMFSVLEGIMIQKRRVEMQAGGERNINVDQREGKPSIHITRNQQILIEFPETHTQEPFPDIFQLMIVNLLELNFKQCLPFQNLKTEQKKVEKTGTTHVKSLVDTIKRPDYKMVLGNKAVLTKAIQILKLHVSDFDLSFATLHDIAFARTKAGNKFKIKHGILAVYLSSVYDNVKMCVAQLLSVLDIGQAQLMPTILPEFELDVSSVPFASYGENILTLKVQNILAENSPNFLSKIGRCDLYKLKIYVFERSKVTDSSPRELQIEDITMLDSTHISLKWNGAVLRNQDVAKMELLYDGDVVECADLPLLINADPDPVSQSHLSSPECGHIKIEKNQSFNAVLLHSVTGDSMNEQTPMQSRCSRFTKRISNVDFEMQVESKHFPSSSPSNPLTIQPVNSNGQLTYSFTVADSKRKIVVRARCTICNQPFRVATQFWCLEPGKAMIINDHE